ncbi:MAG: polysaccharide export protein [Chthonomonadaceae bacterium]|nr:polysaccharide export protein [Chthonomonadaceae bacterium]
MRYLILCSLLCLMNTPVVRADDATPKQAPPAAAPGTSAYRIAPQDVLDITIQDHADLSKTTTVLPDGTISYPYVGEFKASGLTLREIADRITGALSKEIASPQVTVTIRTLHERTPSQVSVLGAAKAAGKYTYKEGWRVLDLLIECGGLPADRGAQFTAVLKREGGETIPLDLPHILSATDTKANILLMPNDVLFINEFIVVPSTAQVLGQVVHPGGVLLPKDGSIIPVLLAVGGPTPQAALTQAQITHNGQTTTVDLSGFLTKGMIDPSIKLESGDELFIPQNKMIFRVLGAVGRSGALTYPENQKVSALDAISMAGGQAQDANLKDASIIHPFKGGKPDITKINLEDVIKKGDISKDVTLQPGDILFVPQRGRSHNPFSFASVLTALSFASIFGL